MADLPVQEKHEEEGDKITIHVRESGGEVISFKVKNTTKMQKVFKAYSDRKGIPIGSFRLVTSDGQPINPDLNPKSLGFEDDEVVDVLSAQIGGY